MDLSKPVKIWGKKGQQRNLGDPPSAILQEWNEWEMGWLRMNQQDDRKGREQNFRKLVLNLMQRKFLFHCLM
jgi:hypothetical protein